MEIHDNNTGKSLNRYFLPLAGFQSYGRMITLMAAISFLVLALSIYFFHTIDFTPDIPIESGIISLVFLTNFFLSDYIKFFKKHLHITNFVLILLATSWGFWIGYRTHFPQNEILGLMLAVFAVTLLLDRPNHIIIFGLAVVAGFNILLSINGDAFSNLIVLTLFIIIMVSIGYIITSARLELMEKLSANEELLELIFQNASDAFILLEPDTLKLIKWNDRAEEWFFENKHQQKQKKIKLPEEILREIKIFGNSKENTRFGELDYSNLQRQKKWAYLNLNRIHFHNHSLIMANLTDITALKTTSLTLDRNRQELEIRNKELKDFAHIASHDLQEPLRMVGSFVQLLEKKYITQLDEKAKVYMQHVTSGVSRMQNLIRDLLIISRLQRSEQIRINTELEDIICDVMQNIKPMIEQSGASIAYDKLPALDVNPTQILQLLQNLITNAIKFQTKNALPMISITAEKKGVEWQIGVKDNGIGIDPLYHTKIFEIFKRLHNQSEYQGTGIGLAICKKIVEQHGGRLWVESESGKGSVFWFTIKD